VFVTKRMHRTFVTVIAGLVSLAFLGAASQAGATIIDLTGSIGSQGTVNGALFRVDTATEATGTGVIESFVQIQANGSNTVERGINTSGRPNAYKDFDAKNDGPHNHDLQLNQLAIRRVNNIPYVEFLLDIDETATSVEKYLSMDAFQVYTSPAASLFSSTFSPAGNELTGTIIGLGTLRYNLDAGADSVVLLNYGLIGSGNGRADMTALVPLSAFSGAAATDYVYLYSYFGNQGIVNGRDYGCSSSFEEWARPASSLEVAPEPATLLLMGLGALGLRLRRRKA
jgi:hypothetical protein